MNRLTFDHIRGDVYGGLTAAVVALPLALAFGVASGAGPVAGLYSAICVGLFAAVFGGTPAQISGPTGSVTVVAATVFTQFAHRPGLAFTVVMLAGVFQIGFSWLKVGRHINLMPYPVISGFMSGIGCIIVLTQLDPYLGFETPRRVVEMLRHLPGHLLHANLDAVFVGATATALSFFTPRSIVRHVPASLVALVVATLLGATVWRSAPTIGAIPSGLPTLHLPIAELDVVREMLVAALVLAILGSIDSLLTSLMADNMTRTFHDSDRELMGQGLGNLVSGLCGGIPGAGAGIYTLANVRSGGHTPLSGVTHALVLLAVALGLGRFASHIPLAALSGILIKVGIDVIDWPFLKRVPRAPRDAGVFMLLVLGLTVFVDVITAVIVGTVLASLLFVKRMADLQSESITVITRAEHPLLTQDEAALLRRGEGRIIVLHLSGPMSFGAANGLTRRMAGASSFDVLVVDVSAVPMVDASATLALEQIVRRARASGWAVLLGGMNDVVTDVFRQLDLLALIPEGDRYVTSIGALSRAVEIVETRPR